MRNPAPSTDGDDREPENVDGREAAREVLSTHGLSEYLDVPVGTVYQWSYRGVGPPAYKVGRHLRYFRSEVDRWVREQRIGPA